jgi:hypothetical protein
MADGLSRPEWEKTGSTAWVQCPACRGWFPVAPALMHGGDVALACPHCAARFPPAAAGAVELP